MNTKEAIEFCNSYAEHCGGWSIEMPKEDESQFKKVINLLQRGEKYKEEWEELVDLNKKTWEMWEEFKFKRGDTYCILDQPDKGTIRDDMNEFEQKYFPKTKEKNEVINEIKMGQRTD